MAVAFSVASWNVENFKNQGARVDTVIAFLDDQHPHVFAIYEVVGKDVFQVLKQRMPNYNVQITEGQNVQEILVGVRRDIAVFFTQRTEFNSQIYTLRPGLLATVTIDDINYPLLFLHVKSGSDPRSLGLRDDMLTRAIKFRSVLDNAPGADGRANYMFLGDLNTMGMEYTWNRDQDIEVQEELEKIDNMAQSHHYRMRRLTKSHPYTWWNGSAAYNPSDLDHVIAANHLRFTQFNGASVAIRGWVDEPTPAQQRTWIDRYSDHCLLYFEVHRPT